MSNNFSIEINILMKSNDDGDDEHGFFFILRLGTDCAVLIQLDFVKLRNSLLDHTSHG